MKIKLSNLKKLINEAVKEQVQDLDLSQSTPEVDSSLVEPSAPVENEEMQNVENLFDYIRQQLEDKNFVMAKRFVDNLKTEIDEMEKRQAGLETIQDTKNI